MNNIYNSIYKKDLLEPEVFQSLKNNIECDISIVGGGFTGLSSAIELAQAAADGRGVDLSDVADRGRDGITGARQRGHIGLAALRGGDVVGEHDVVFASASERIKLSHIATSREVFSKGAVRAALWSEGADPGLYDMLDVLGFSGRNI